MAAEQPRRTPASPSGASRMRCTRHRPRLTGLSCEACVPHAARRAPYRCGARVTPGTCRCRRDSRARPESDETGHSAHKRVLKPGIHHIAPARLTEITALLTAFGPRSAEGGQLPPHRDSFYAERAVVPAPRAGPRGSCPRCAAATEPQAGLVPRSASRTCASGSGCPAPGRAGSACPRPRSAGPRGARPPPRGGPR